MERKRKTKSFRKKIPPSPSSRPNNSKVNPSTESVVIRPFKQTYRYIVFAQHTPTIILMPLAFTKNDPIWISSGAVLLESRWPTVNRAGSIVHIDEQLLYSNRTQPSRTEVCAEQDRSVWDLTAVGTSLLQLDYINPVWIYLY